MTTSFILNAVPIPAQVTALLQVQEYPAVSLLLTTTPATALIRSDAQRLDALAATAAQRLRAELPPETTTPVVRRLHKLIDQAHAGPTGKALVLYVSAGTHAVIRLPISVRDRVVIDPTFATRDLVRALHRTPRHLVLALKAGEARLYDAVADTLLPALTSAFPLHADRRQARGRGYRSGPDTDASTLDFYRQVDAALGTYARLHPAPLVLVGDHRATAAFQRLSANCARLAGTVHGNLTTTAVSDLTARICATLEDYLHRRQNEALALLEQRCAAGRVAAGMPAAWFAARTGRPEMLVVDEALYYPARLSVDGDTLIPATDVDHPDVIDDAVDELIELVLSRGGWIAFAAAGTLDDHQGVALSIRR
jgi:hypothetical protein